MWTSFRLSPCLFALFFSPQPKLFDAPASGPSLIWSWKASYAMETTWFTTVERKLYDVRGNELFVSVSWKASLTVLETPPFYAHDGRLQCGRMQHGFSLSQEATIGKITHFLFFFPSVINHSFIVRACVRPCCSIFPLYLHVDARTFRWLWR